MSTLTERMDRFELDLRRMQRELEALRRDARTTAPAEPEASPVPVVAAVVEEPEPVPAPIPHPPATLPPGRHLPRVDLGELLARFDLLGARGVAVPARAGAGP